MLHWDSINIIENSCLGGGIIQKLYRVIVNVQIVFQANKLDHPVGWYDVNRGPNQIIFDAVINGPRGLIIYYPNDPIAADGKPM